MNRQTGAIQFRLGAKTHRGVRHLVYEFIVTLHRFDDRHVAGPGQRFDHWGYSWDDCSDCRGGTSAASQYRLRVVNNELITQSIERTAGTNDVYRVQFSIRYMF